MEVLLVQEKGQYYLELEDTGRWLHLNYGFESRRKALLIYMEVIQPLVDFVQKQEGGNVIQVIVERNDEYINWTVQVGEERYMVEAFTKNCIHARLFRDMVLEVCMFAMEGVKDAKLRPSDSGIILDRVHTA